MAGEFDDLIPSSPSLLESGLRGLGQGMTLGFAPKASALARSAIVNPTLDVLNKNGIGPGGTGQTYEQMRDEYINANNDALKAHPVEYLGSSFFGGGPAAMATGGRFVPSMAEGAVEGASKAYDSNQDLLGNIVTGAGINGAVTGAGALVKKGLGFLSDNVVSRLADPDMSEQRVRDLISEGKRAYTKISYDSALGDLYDSAKGAFYPLLGSVVGSTVGYNAAPLVGADPKTGAELGFIAGGRMGLSGAKKNIIESATKGTAKVMGTANLQYPNVVRNSTVPIMAASQSLNKYQENPPMSSTGAFDEFLPENDKRTRLQKLSDRFQQQMYDPGGP